LVNNLPSLLPVSIVWLSGLIGACAGCSFQPISASTEREACVTGLLQVQETPDMLVADWLDPLSNAIICLAQGETDTTVREACVTDLVRINANPNYTMEELIDANSEAVICLART
jgi:hypothetical protein